MTVSDDEAPDGVVTVRVSALRQTADLLADSIAHGARTLAFVRSRRGAELVSTMAKRWLAESVPRVGRSRRRLPRRLSA